jgi:hypothetical protein
MGSDRARISYDQKQHYRSVVMQQGRVTLEADWNEAQLIASEETRKEALDFVGPAGTPDNGYAITLPASGFDFQIGAGTMYVGGVRVHLSQAESYSQQKQNEWLDFAIDGDWVAVPTDKPGSNEYVYLFLREQEVSAVEDSDLKDVALGGPDTAQRTRLIQHVERLSTSGTDCPSALTDAETKWAAKGFEFDTNDMRVQSFARLQVGFVSTDTSTVCDPTPLGGYLGADNQLIRVQISDLGSGPRLLWGYDDASFLYRVTVADAQTVTLQTAPIDTEHIPQGGQAVEVLMDAALLDNGQYVAAPVGQVFTLASSSYDSDSRRLSLPSALPSVYGDGTSTNPGPPQVFLRVWEQELPFTPGTPVTLGDTGVQVTLTSKNNEPFRTGDYWVFAVRPGTPQQVYPERYLASAQRPEGPREWICPLAVLLWTASTPTAGSCRNLFDNLVTLTGREGGGCCTIFVTADEQANNSSAIQDAINQLLGTGGTLCLGPGTFQLPGTLNIKGVTHAIQIVGEGAGPMFQAGPGVTTLVAAAPTEGVSNPAILIDSSQGVTIQDLELQFAPGTTTVTVKTNLVSGAGTPVLNPGIMIQDSSLVTVQRCTLTCSGNQVPGNPAIGLGGFVGQTTIRENVMQFNALDANNNPIIGFGAGVIRQTVYQDQPFNFLFTFDLYIRDNIMQCGTSGVYLDFLCYHAGQVDVSNNFIGPCVLVGIDVQGLGIAAPWGRVEINNNEVVGFGAGLAAGVPARICNNDLVLATSPGNLLFSGIIIQRSALQQTTIDGTQIVGNRVTGSPGYGIWIDAPVGSAVITDNVIENSAAGGIFVGSGADHLSISNNQLLKLVPSATDPFVTSQGAYGIYLLPAVVNNNYVEQGYLEIEGNIIKDFATDPNGSVARVGIAAYGYISTRIAGNQLINLGPPNTTVNRCSGIEAGFYPFDRAEVSGNVVRRSDAGATDLRTFGPGIFIYGYQGLQERKLQQMSGHQAVQISESQFVIVNPAGLAQVSTTGLQNATVRGNYVEVTGSAPAALVVVGGSCTFTENQCLLSTENVYNPVADLEGATLVASNNVLQGTGDKDLTVNLVSGTFTVLGNIATGPILVNGNTLHGTPWGPLNIPAS